MKAALVQEERVINVIEYDPSSEYNPPDEVKLIELNGELVGPDWTMRDGQFIQPFEQSLRASPSQIPANSSSSSTVTYTNTYDDAPTEVTFDVNGTTAVVSLVDGEAQIEIVAEYPDKIVVICDGLDVTIIATEE